MYTQKKFKMAINRYLDGIQIVKNSHYELANTEWAFDYENTVHNNIALIHLLTKKYSVSIEHSSHVLKRDKFNYKAHYRYAIAKLNSSEDKYDMVTVT